MFYFVLLAAVLLFLSLVSLVDPSGRRRVMQRPIGREAKSLLQANVELIAAEMQRRYGSRHPGLLRVPDSALHGERKEEQPCLTPIECVQDKRCDGHCGCH